MRFAFGGIEAFSQAAWIASSRVGPDASGMDSGRIGSATTRAQYSAPSRWTSTRTRIVPWCRSIGPRNAEQVVSGQPLPAFFLEFFDISVFGWSIGARPRQRCHHISVRLNRSSLSSTLGTFTNGRASKIIGIIPTAALGFPLSTMTFAIFPITSRTRGCRQCLPVCARGGFNVCFLGSHT
jgi:hypothetical protein